MQITSSRPVADTLTAVGSLAAVVLGVLVVSEDARAWVRSASEQNVESLVAAHYARMHVLVRATTDVIGRDHLEIAAFVTAGLVLFLLMFKL